MSFELASLWSMLSQLAIAQWVKTSSWGYPIMETAHVIGLSLLFGGLVVLHLRLLGFARALALAPLGALILPWVWLGFVINAASGALLFLSDPAEFAANQAFQFKMVLLVLAGINAFVFHKFLYRDATRLLPPEHVESGRYKSASFAARAGALLSVMIWLGVITMGRMIAYWA